MEKWYAKRKTSELLEMDKSKILVFDTETTGLTPDKDDILQITFLDGNGKVLLSSYIHPTRKKNWERSEQYHHITPDKVKDAPTMKDLYDEIQDLFTNASLVVGYNLDFDIRFVEADGFIVEGKKFDVMQEFSAYKKGIEHSKYEEYTLQNCASYFGYELEPHNSMEDAQATLFCFDALIHDPRFTAYDKEERKELEETMPAEPSELATGNVVKARKRYPLIMGLLSIFVGFAMLSPVAGVYGSAPHDIEKMLKYALKHFGRPYIIAGTVLFIGGIITVIVYLTRYTVKGVKRSVVKGQRIKNKL